MIKCKKERKKLKRLFTDFVGFSALFAMCAMAADGYAAQAPNPRSATSAVSVGARNAGNTVVRGNSDNAKIISGVARSAVKRASGAKISARSAMPSSADGVRGNVSNARSATVSRAAQGRSAVAFPAGGARSAAHNVSKTGMARAASVARATAVFNDVSKIGGGYAECRDAYATCMDQFCANANDTYRRCYCSARFTGFRDTEYALDEAKTLLMRFEDNSLNAVDKSAAEVNAMYTATVGEAAIKRDTSAAQDTLDEIADLLAGKKKKTTGTYKANVSTGIMPLDFSTDVGDIWSGDGSDIFGGGNSIFDTSTGVDMSSLEGEDLYNAANQQCAKLASEMCQSNAVFSMATSAYGILISQDCNAYEKKVESQREAVLQTVRQAEKYLREARLEEYRAHNSADVNECVAKVRSAILTDNACGANYGRCLDYTGMYINPVTAEPIYSPQLFKLTEVIKLDGTGDVVVFKEGHVEAADNDNAGFIKFLDDKRIYAASALDTCRDIADTVWLEFIRQAFIEIAQAQDEKIESVKTSCVTTMKQCYDTQSEALKSFDDTTAQAAGALAASAARAMCADKVQACAALYGKGECNLDTKTGKFIGDGCGLKELIDFVDRVDDVRIAEGCATALDNYVKDLCTPTTGTMGYPWNCRMKSLGTESDAPAGGLSASIWANIKYYAVENCLVGDSQSYDNLEERTRLQIARSIQDIEEALDAQLMETCETLDGYWVNQKGNDDKLLSAFYKNTYAGDENETWGACVENTVRVRCLDNNTDGETIATYDAARDECIFTDEWYNMKCQSIGGYYNNGTCYIMKE